MIYCSHCNREVSHEDEKGYEVSVNRWTMNFPKVREYFIYHENCWSEKFNSKHRAMPTAMEDLFGEIIEPLQ